MKTAVILAAGKGKKIWPYNEYWPKAALTVGGVPNIIRFIKNLKECQIERIIVVTAHLERSIRYLLSGAEGVRFSQHPLYLVQPIVLKMF